MKERNVLQSFVGFMDIETVQKNKLGIGNSSEVDTNNFLNSGFCGIPDREGFRFCLLELSVSLHRNCESSFFNSNSNLIFNSQY